MTTRISVIHLVYPSGPTINAPASIGRHLIQRLGQRYPVRLHRYDLVGAIEPEPGAVLIGHPHPAPGTVFRRSARKPGWARILGIAPFSPGRPWLNAYMDSLIDRWDLYLGITGPYWLRTLDRTPFAHWRPKIVQLDLAVHRAEFPLVKRRFAPRGERRFLYIGHNRVEKDPAYLSQIAQRFPGRFSWIGSDTAPGGIPGLEHLGVRDFRDEETLNIVAQHDFVITVSRSDANPTTVLESMAWGLIPVCTPESGYADIDGLVHVPFGDADTAEEILRRLDNLPEDELVAMRLGNLEALDSYFNWDRFAAQVIEAIENNDSPRIRRSLAGRTRLRAAALQSPHQFARPRNAIPFGREVLGI